MENENTFNFDSLRQQAKEDKTVQAKLLDIIKSTDVGKAYAETIAKNYFDENISSEHKKIYDFVDKAFIDAGLEKPDGMKTSEFAALVAKQNQELKSKVDSLKDSSTDAQLAKKLDDLKARHKKEKQELINTAQTQLQEKESMINELTNKQSLFTKETELNKRLQNMEFNKSYDEKVLNDIIQLKKHQLIQNAKEEDGKIVWCKSDGTPYKDGILNASIDVILKSELAHILDNSLAGGQAGNAPTKSDFNGTQVVIDENSFKTQEQFLQEFDKVAQRKGIPKGEDYNKLYWEAFERYSISSLREF